MEQSDRIYSASELDKGAGVLPRERRRMVKLGVLKPRRTAAGHAIYVEADLEIARQWKLARHGRGGRAAR